MITHVIFTHKIALITLIHLYPGATAIEDKLQDKVSETIVDLHRAGIYIYNIIYIIILVTLNNLSNNFFLLNKLLRNPDNSDNPEIVHVIFTHMITQ